MNLFASLMWANVLFFGMLLLGYLFVSRRRAKVYALVDHLASMAARSLPIATGLRMLAADLGGLFGARLGKAARRVEDGASLGEALTAVPGAFPPLVRALVVQGERGGNLAAFLEELRRVYARQVEKSGASIYALFYPLIVALMVNGGILALHSFIVPKFAEVFEQMKLPNEHRVAWSWLILSNEVVLAGVCAVVLLVLCGAGSARFGSLPFRRLSRLLDPLVLALPVFGTLVRQGAFARLCLGSGLFLRAGAGLPDAVRAAADVEPNRVLARRFLRLGDALAEGRRFSEAGRSLRVLPDDLLWFAETGEATGDLPGHLLQAAAHCDAKAEASAERASRLVAPAFVLLNGALVLGTGLLLLLPLSEILKKLVAW